MKNYFLYKFILILLITTSIGCYWDSREHRIDLLALYPETGPKGWELDETNTGLKENYSNLSVLSDFTGVGYFYGTEGPIYITANNITISDKQINYQVMIQGKGVVLERCLIRPIAVGMGMPLVTGLDATIQDSEIDGSLIADADIIYSIAYSGTGIIERCNIHGAATGIYINNVGSKVSVAQGNYVHGLRYISPAHVDGLTIRRSNGIGTIVRNNRLVTDVPATGALYIQPFQGFINNVLIKGNLLEGIGNNLGLENIPYNYGNNMRAINNRFNPYPGSGWGYVGGGPGWFEWSENYKYNSGAADGKGDAIPSF